MCIKMPFPIVFHSGVIYKVFISARVVFKHLIFLMYFQVNNMRHNMKNKDANEDARYKYNCVLS